MNIQYKGIFPALQCPFDQKLNIDEPEPRKFVRWLAGHKGIGGLVTNGHTGEIFALTAKQRAEVTRIVADEVKGKQCDRERIWHPPQRRLIAPVGERELLAGHRGEWCVHFGERGREGTAGMIAAHSQASHPQH